MKKRVNSLRFQILWPVALTVVLIVVLMTMAVTRTFTQKLLYQENERVQNAFSISGMAIENLLSSLRTTASRLILDGDIEAYATRRADGDLEKVRMRRKVLETLNTTMKQNPALYGIIFLRGDGSAFGTLPFRTVFFDDSSSETLSPSVLEHILSGDSFSAWSTPLTGAELYGIPINSSIPEKTIIGVTRNRSLAYGTIYSLAVVDAATLRGYVELLANERGGVYLTTADGAEICRSSGCEPFEAEIFDAIGESDQGTVREASGDQTYISRRAIPSLGWYLVQKLPIDVYDSGANEIRWFVVKVAIAVFSVALLVYFQWFRGFMRSFDALKAAVVSLREGNLGMRIQKPFAIAEFEEIRNEFNTMNAALERQMEKVRVMERVQLELELRTMQTQLSPHMIFNSITAIRWMATMVGADRVSDMLSELSEMLRPVFRDWRIAWKLEDELIHLTHYAKLLDLRYGNNFCMTTDVDQAMLQLDIPRFTIQPLVENACEHGGFGVEKMIVSVSGWIEGGWAHLRVGDNGSGIAPETLAKIRERLLAGEKMEGVGLSSVLNRTRICLGQESRMRIECPESGGTRVTISWPLNMKS